jgi:hypothetical protein
MDDDWLRNQPKLKKAGTDHFGTLQMIMKERDVQTACA